MIRYDEELPKVTREWFGAIVSDPARRIRPPGKSVFAVAAQIVDLINAGTISRDDGRALLDNIQGKEKPMDTTPIAPGQIRQDGPSPVSRYEVLGRMANGKWKCKWQPGSLMDNQEIEYSEKALLGDWVMNVLVPQAATDPREPTMEDMKAFASDPYNHHDWAKYVPARSLPEVGPHVNQFRVGDVWAYGPISVEYSAVFKVIGGKVGDSIGFEILAGCPTLGGAGKEGYGFQRMSMLSMRSHLIARMENGALRMVGIDKPAERYQGDGMADYWSSQRPVADLNLRPAPKPNFHGVKVGCRLRFPGDMGHLDESFNLKWISRQGVSNLPPASPAPRCKTGTACKSPADAPLGYLGLCWPCNLQEEKRQSDVMAAGDVVRDGKRSRSRPVPTFYDNSRSAGIGVAGTIWKLRG